jgi:hypothetical protein
VVCLCGACVLIAKVSRRRPGQDEEIHDYHGMTRVQRTCYDGRCSCKVRTLSAEPSSTGLWPYAPGMRPAGMRGGFLTFQADVTLDVLGHPSPAIYFFRPPSHGGAATASDLAKIEMQISTTISGARAVSAARYPPGDLRPL